jgi:hypothetical protein
VARVDEALFRGLLKQHVPRTLVLVTADHGVALVRESAVIDLEQWSDLDRLQSLQPGGDPRLAQLYTRDDTKWILEQWLCEHLADACTVATCEEALAAGLFGPGNHAPWRERLGDVLVLPEDGVGLRYRTVNHGGGWYGGTSPDELDVPIIAVRLDR